MRIRLPQIIAVAAMILLMTFLFIKTNVIESDAHNRFSQHLRQLKELDATLDKDVLESRYGLLTTYDVLIAEIGELNRLQVELKKIPDFLDRNEQREVANLLNEFGSLQGEKENLLERFKSRNAIINNSLRYFPVATSNLIKNAEAASAGQQKSEPLNYLLRDVLIYYLLTDSELKPAIAERIEFLQQRQKENPSSAGKTDLDITVSHARTILRLKPEVDELVGQIIALPTTDKVADIIGLYDLYYDKALRRAETYRLLLYVFSVLLLAYIAYIILKLKKATAELNAVNENLEQRVHERTEELSWSNTELQKSEANNKALLHAIPDSMWRTNKDGVFLDFIPAKGANAIAPSSDWIGKTIFEVLPADVARQTIRMAEQSLKTSDTQIFEYQLSRNDNIHHYESRVIVYGESEVLTIVREITERKHIEQALSASRERERAMIENALDVICTIDTEGRFISINPACFKMWGYQPEELIGRRFIDFVTPEDIAKTIAEDASILSGEEATNFENRYVHKNGTLVDVRWTSYFSESEQLIFAVAHDITERRRAEEVVQNSLDYLDRIINAVADPIFVMNRRHQLTLVNDAFCRFTKRSREEVIGKTSYDLFSAEEADGFWEKDELVFTLGEENINEEQFTDPQGNAHCIIARKRLHIDKDGEQFIVGVSRDITESKKTEETLRENEAKFRDLFDNAPVAYHELDTEGCFRRVNHTEELLLGYTEAELIGRHPAEIIVEKTSRDATAAKLSGKLPLHPVERTFIHKDGSLVSVLNEDRLIFDRDGVVTGIRSTLQNITERKLLEDKLQRGQKLESIGQLAAGIAHEINTPTQYVGDNVRFLKDSFLDFSEVLEKTGQMLESCRTNNINPELVAELEKTIEQADIEYLLEEIPKSFVQALDGIGRISKIVQSMKDFAHPGSTDKRAADLNKSIESTITVASNEWKYVAEIVTDYDKTLPLVPCLIGEFNQVVLNMIVNAAHAISEVNGDGGAKGIISISTRHKGDWAEIRISDTGAGIPEDVRKKIFDPFFTTKAVGKGTGQGLAISHTVIVEKHKGLIDVESEVGTGTTFIICLPVNEEASESGENPAAMMLNPLAEFQLNESNF